MSSPTGSTQRTLAERIKEHRAVALLLVIAGIVTAITTLSGPVRDVYGAMTWRNAEEQKIEGIRVGMTTDAMTANLGAARGSERITDGTRYIWKGRGYWVVAFIQNESVSSYSVQVCDPAMHPRLQIGDLAITANETTLAEASIGPPQDVWYNYTPSRSDIFEGIQGSHAQAFRRVFWGVGEACPSEWRGQGEFPPLFFCTSNEAGLECKDAKFNKINPETSADFKAMRKGFVINTIGEQAGSGSFAPSHTLDVFWEEFNRLG